MLSPENNSRRRNQIEKLTSREVEVMAAWLNPAATAQSVAIGLGISAHTVKFHINTIYQKLGVNRRYAAALKFINLYPEYQPALTQPLFLESEAGPVSATPGENYLPLNNSVGVNRRQKEISPGPEPPPAA